MIRRLWHQLRTRIDRVATARRILIAGWFAIIMYAFPGYMTWDSVQQLQEARHPPLTDWHPPLMALLWRFTDFLIAGPFPMLVIQTGSFLFGAAAIQHMVMSRRAAAGCAVGLLLFPPVMVVLGVIWKDSLMAGLLLAGTSLVLLPRGRRRYWGLAILWFASALRYNAPFAALPLLLLLPTWKSGVVGWRRYLISAAVWFGVTVLAFAANRIATGRPAYAWHNSVALFDIVGVVHDAPPLSDADLRTLLVGMPMRAENNIQVAFRNAYDPNGWNHLVSGDQSLLRIPDKPSERDAVSHAWWCLVTKYPEAYFAHRRRMFYETLALKHPVVGAVWDRFTPSSFDGDLIDHRAHQGWWQQWIAKQWRKLERSWLFRPWIYLVLAILLMPLCRSSRAAFAFFCSGILYEFTLLIMAPSTDYRYSHWLMTATSIGMILLVSSRFKLGRAHNQASTTVSGQNLPGSAGVATVC